MRVAIVACALLSALFATRAVYADALPPPGDCASKKEGEPCHDYLGKAGTCGTITYTSIRGSERHYFGCREGATPATSSAPATSPTSATPVTPVMPATPAADGGGSTPGPSSSGKRCSVAAPGLRSRSPVDLFALAPVALAAFACAARRRRPRTSSSG